MRQIRKCSIEGCESRHYCRQLCVKHYSTHKKRGTLPQRIRHLSICRIDDCESKPSAQGYCAKHYHRLQRYGDPLAGPGRGSPGKSRGPKKGIGEYVSNGYKRIRVVDHEGASARWVLEHRHIMAQWLERALYPDENVHHIDGNKLNNAPENLELWVTRQPQGQRVQDLLAWARAIIERYG